MMCLLFVFVYDRRGDICCGVFASRLTFLNLVLLFWKILFINAVWLDDFIIVLLLHTYDVACYVFVVRLGMI